MFTSDLFTVLIDRTSQKGVLAGFLSQKQQFGHAEVDLRNSPVLLLKAAGDEFKSSPVNLCQQTRQS